MAATVFVSAAVGAADNTSTLETAAFTVGGSNRVLYVLAGSGAGTPVDASAVRWGGSGGTALTQISTTLNLGVNAKMSLWRLIAPATGSNTVHASWGSNQDERWLIAVQVQDADQTTPNGTVATATGTDAAPTAAAASVSGDLVLDFMSWLDLGGRNLTVTDDVPDSLQELEAGAISAYEGAGASRETASGTSTTCSWTLSASTGGDGGWGIFALAINEAEAGAPFDLAPTSGVALHGGLTLAGDIAAGTPTNIVPTSGVALSGRLAVSGDIRFSRPWELEPPLQISQMTGALRVLGDIGFTVQFDVAPISAVSMHGLLAVAGDVGAPAAFNLAPLAALALRGTLSASGDVGVLTTFNLTPAGAVGMVGRLGVACDFATLRAFDFAPISAVSMHGLLSVTGDVDSVSAAPFNVAPLGALTLHGLLSAAGDVASLTEIDVTAGVVGLHGQLAVVGDIGIAVPVLFDLPLLGALPLNGRLTTTTGDIRAGSPFDLAAGGVTLRGGLTATGDVASSTAPPTPPPPSATDPLDPKLIARRKRPNIRMRWGSGEEPAPPAAAPQPAPIELATESPRLARGLDLGLLPEPPPPAAPTPEPPATPTAPAAPVAPPTVPAAPAAPPAVLPPDLTTEVAALRAAHASLQQEMQQAAAQAVQRAADVYAALQQQTAHLERELAQARSEITSLRTKIERDARNRRRAEEIARKLLDDK